MTRPAFLGYLFLSCGPPLALGIPFFWHRSLLSLTIITSMFFWLIVMIVTSMLFRGFVPLQSDVGPYAAMLMFTVLFEELFRVGLWFMHKFSARKLKDLAATGSVRYDDLDELSLAYSIGWGHGFLHLMMQFLPMLPLTWYKPTAYSTECPQMSLFLVSCLSQLGMFSILAGALHFDRTGTVHLALTAFPHLPQMLLLNTPLQYCAKPLSGAVIIHELHKLAFVHHKGRLICTLNCLAHNFLLNGPRQRIAFQHSAYWTPN
jgi:hypothetical protein